MSLSELYQDMVVDHYKAPRNFGKLNHTTHSAEGYNPLCGDKVFIYLDLQGDEIKDIHFEGSGCAISTASASLATEYLKSKKISEFEVVFKKFHQLVTEEVSGVDSKNAPDLGKLAILEGVKEFPTRVKCATLVWHTIKNALKNLHDVATTE